MVQKLKDQSALKTIGPAYKKSRQGLPDGIFLCSSNEPANAYKAAS
jgi:hypothetical protein